jgi:2-polyprenyl-6-methoxyphenol hydroxylase-like FAD-dependent oxidoreductase
MNPSASGQPDPVLIAGAGPVGLATALLLARWQVPSLVLEAADEAAKGQPVGSRAICFQRDVLDIFDRVGCADSILGEGVTWSTGRTYYRGHELFAVDFPDPGPGSLPPWINISQGSVERYLLARARTEPLIELRFGHEVTGIADSGDFVEVAAVTVSGPLVVHGSHLVGADGARSTVRQSLGIEFPGHSFDDQFLICDIKADLDFPNERRFFFDPAWNPGRQVLVHQCPDGVWRIDWQVPAGFDLEAERADGGLDTRIRQITGSAPYEIVWASAYRFHERVAERLSAGMAYLAGDAAHLYAPFGARGLNSGLQDAENLAWKLAFVRRGWAPARLLDSYHAERGPAAAENLRVTSATMDFLVPQTDDARRLRAATLDRALTDPSARAHIDSGKLAEPFWYADSPLTTAGAPRAGFPTVAGASRPPVAGVLCPDGPCRLPDEPGHRSRLRRLFGRSFVVLTQSEANAAAAAAVARCALSGPVDVYALDQIDDTGQVRAAVEADDDSVHVVRPDGHLAAVLARLNPAMLTAALHRAVAI